MSFDSQTMAGSSLCASASIFLLNTVALVYILHDCTHCLYDINKAWAQWLNTMEKKVYILKSEHRD